MSNLFQAAAGRVMSGVRTLLTVVVAVTALAAPTGALALSGQCLAINNNQIALGAGNSAPGTLSGTYAIGNQSFGGEQLSSSNYSDFNQPLAPGEVIHFSWTRNSGAGYVQVTLQEQSGFTLRSGSTENVTAASGSGSITVGSANDIFNIAVTNYSVDAANGVTNAAEAGRNNSSVTFNISCSAVAPTVTGVSPNAGPTGGGASVTITGTNFTGATGAGGVKFGGTNATSYTVNSSTQITAVAPAGAAGTVDVTVTNGGATSAISASDRYTYVAAPTVTSVSPVAGPTGGGTTVVITGTGFATAPGTDAVKFGGANATYTINSATQITATSPANTAGIYDITVTTPGGTSATSALDQFTYVAAPTVTGLSANAGPIGGGATVVITGTNLSNATAVTFGGTAAVGYTINGPTQITATAPAGGAGTVNVRVTTTGGTSATAVANQFTYVLPPVSSSQTYGSIVAYNEGSNQTTNIDLSLYLTGGGAPTSYAVGSATTAQGGTVSVNSSGMATYTPPAGYRNANDSFTYTATNAGGTSAPATVTVTIGNPTITVALPSAMATVERAYNVGGSPVTASGGRATYTVNSISGLPSGLTYSGGVISGTPAANGVYTVTVNLTDSSLGAGPYNANATATLTVSHPPAPVASSFSINGLTYNTGAATPTTFSAAPHVTESPTGYQVGASSYGGSVSVDSAGLMSYTPPVGFRGTDVFNYVGTNAGGTSNVGQVFVTVNDPVFSVSLPASTGAVGQAYNSGGAAVVMTGGNAPYNNFSASGLPAGLTMDSSGVISGTPTTAGNGAIVVTATDNSGGNGSYTSTASANLTIAAPTIVLSPASGALPGAQAGFSYSQTITSTGGVAPITYGVTAGGLPPGLALSTGGSISGAPTATGTYNFTVTGTDSSGNSYSGAVAYSITVTAPTITVAPGSLPAATVGAAYSQTLTASGGTAPYSFDLDTGSLPDGMSLSTAGVLSGAPTQGGGFAFTVRAKDSTSGGTYSATQSYALSVGVPSITLGAGPLAGGTVGAAYSATLSASGGTPGYTYQVTSGSLPPGLTLSTGGAVTGTSTGGGTYNFTVTATDSSTGSGPYTGAAAYSISMGAPTVTVGPTSVSNAKIGAAYSQTLTTSGGTATYSYAVTAGDLPAGLSLNGATGAISGTPTQAGSFSYTVTATDSSTGTGAPFTGSHAYSMNVGAPTLTMTPSTLAGMTVGSPFTATITAGGGTAPWNYFMYGGTVLPQGLTLSPTGEITGTPTAGGSFSFTIAATDSSTGTDAPFTVTRAYTVNVAAATVSITTATLPDGQVASAYSQTLAATGGTAPYAFAVTVGTLPPGLRLESGVILGTPTAHGTYNFTVTATDSSTGVGPYTGVRAYALTIGLPNPPVAAPVNLAVGYNAGDQVVTPSLSGPPATSVAVATGPSHGTATVSGMTFLYTPTPGYFGPDSFTYTASNEGGTSAPATVSLTVATPPAPTTSNPAAQAVPYDSTGVAIDLTSSVGGVYSSLAVATAPSHGAASVSGSVVTYVPTAGYFGSDSFTFTATGPGGTSAPATVSVLVATPPAPVIETPTGPTPVPPAPGGGVAPVTVALAPLTEGVLDGYRITAVPQFGSAEVSLASASIQAMSARASAAPAAAPAPAYQLTYTPAPDFMGTDTVSVVAYGPGGESSPVVFTFQVAGKAPDLSAQVLSNAVVAIKPTAGLRGGPFNALRITRAPGFGAATVQGLDIVFNPGVANGGATSLDYVVDLPFGSSAAGRIDLTSNLVPGAQVLTAETIQGRPVTVRVSDAVGGPFTGAAVVSISPTTAGSATIAGSGGVYDLTFTPAGTFSGEVTTVFSLSNAFGTTESRLTITVKARPDPSLDPEVRGVATSQVTTARRFADAQIDNFQRRLQDLHDGGNGSSNGLSLNLGAESDTERDPRQALRRQLGQDRNLDPGALTDGRDRDMLGRDLWADRRAEGGVTASDRLNASAQPGGSVIQADGKLGFWTAGSVDWGRQQADGQRDSRFTTQGVTAGLDVRLSDRLIFGAGLGYGEDKSRIGDQGSVSRGEAVTGALYASWRPVEDYYLDGVLGLSQLDFTSRRWVSGLAGQANGYADGERSGDVRFVSAAFGRITRGDGLIHDLYARVEARDIVLDGFTETGGGLAALIWDEVEQKSLSANIGAAWRWNLETRRFGVFRPSARVEWSHEFEDIGTQGVRYADWAASPTYLVPLNAWSRNALNLNLETEWSLSEHLMFSLGYRGMLGDQSTSHGAEIRLKFGW